MKNKSINKFSDSVLKADLTKNVTGGYGEGLETTGCRPTYQVVPRSMMERIIYDTEAYGDFYSSC